MLRLGQLIIGTLSIFSATVVYAGACTLSPLPINPVTSTHADTFIGQSQWVDVEFKNEKMQGDVETFPEPPLIIRNRKSNTTCSIDGGIWVRKSVFISQNADVVVTQEYSGSNDFLNFYNTATCKKMNEINVSNSTWKILGSKISVSKQPLANAQGKVLSNTYHLDASCHPSK